MSWVGKHLTVYRALQDYFIDANRPVPASTSSTSPAFFPRDRERVLAMGQPCSWTASARSRSLCSNVRPQARGPFRPDGPHGEDGSHGLTEILGPSSHNAITPLSPRGCGPEARQTSPPCVPLDRYCALSERTVVSVNESKQLRTNRTGRQSGFSDSAKVSYLPVYRWRQLEA